MLVWSQTLPSLATVQSIDSKTNHDYWLVFNECENYWQCNQLPEDQAQFYHDQVLPLIYDQGGDPDAKLIIGGSTAHECGVSWMTRFIEAYRTLYGEDPPRAGWHFHVYPDVGLDPDIWQPGQPCPDNSWGGFGVDRANINYYIEDTERFKQWWIEYGSAGDEIWLTETGCPAVPFCPDTDVHPDMVDYIAAITAYLNDEGRWINRYAWYTTIDPDYPTTWLVTDYSNNPAFTDIGNYYAQVTPSAWTPGFPQAFMPLVLNNYPTGASPLSPPPIMPEAPLPAYPSPAMPDASRLAYPPPP